MRILFAASILLLSTAASAQQPTLDSAKLKTLASEAQAFANAGNYDSAAILAKQILAMGVRDSNAYFLTAVVLTLGGHKAEGQRYYDTAIAEGYDPNTSTAMMLGLSKPLADTLINVDSAFAAIDTKAIQESKQLPKGYKNARLYEIYEEDQGERMLMIHLGMKKAEESGIIMRMVQHDAARKKELYAILPELKKSRATGDLEEAGLILQHGDDTTDYWNAHELAMRAMHLGDTNALWLAAATLDRYLVKKGLPQKYGTQSTVDPKTGKLVLAPVDPTVTDAERAKWHVPPLKDALKTAQGAYRK